MPEGENTYQANAMDLHALVGELGSHGNEVSRNLNWVLEGHGWILIIRAQVSILNAHLPHHRA